MSAADATPNGGYGDIDGKETQMAERPKDGESWREMIERQLRDCSISPVFSGICFVFSQKSSLMEQSLREGNNQNGYLRELLRSLPDEQQQDNGRGGRGDNTSPFAPAQDSFMANGFEQSYQDMLREASLRGGPERDQSIER